MDSLRSATIDDYDTAPIFVSGDRSSDDDSISLWNADFRDDDVLTGRNDYENSQKIVLKTRHSFQIDDSSSDQSEEFDMTQYQLNAESSAQPVFLSPSVSARVSLQAAISKGLNSKSQDTSENSDPSRVPSGASQSSIPSISDRFRSRSIDWSDVDGSGYNASEHSIEILVPLHPQGLGLLLALPTDSNLSSSKGRCRVKGFRKSMMGGVDSPCISAGLRIGDLLDKLDGKRVFDDSDISAALQSVRQSRREMISMRIIRHEDKVLKR